MNCRPTPTSFRSAFFGLCGAGIAFLLLAVFVYSMVIFPEFGDVEIAIVSRFGPNSFVYTVLASLPLMMLSGCFIGFFYARITARRRETVHNVQLKHPLD